jgi:hypothetical protein
MHNTLMQSHRLETDKRRGIGDTSWGLKPAFWHMEENRRWHATDGMRSPVLMKGRITRV